MEIYCFDNQNIVEEKNNREIDTEINIKTRKLEYIDHLMQLELNKSMSTMQGLIRSAGRRRP